MIDARTQTLARRLARPLAEEEVARVSGGESYFDQFCSGQTFATTAYYDENGNLVVKCDSSGSRY
ncbi:MAG: hypothetical protein KatS3mg119_1974 [Rhodothalassiaceae bacterium]|nr:MAG: hypothetical protein KatS3mg119_1974 [Rhodothalassiaceae bacterium]